MGTTQHTTISVEPELRDELRACKRGQESYTALLERMLEQYEVDAES